MLIKSLKKPIFFQMTKFSAAKEDSKFLEKSFENLL